MCSQHILAQQEHSAPVAFFDRDGTLIQDQHYRFDEDKLVWLPGALEAIRYLNLLGWKVVVVTNQSAVARGFCTEIEVRRFHQAMVRRATQAGAIINAFEYCPFLPDAALTDYRSFDHPDRKPNPGMILRHLPKVGKNRENSFLIGDKTTDIEAANNAGIAGYIYEKGQNLMHLIEKVTRVYKKIEYENG